MVNLKKEEKEKIEFKKKKEWLCSAQGVRTTDSFNWFSCMISQVRFGTLNPGLTGERPPPCPLTTKESCMRTNFILYKEMTHLLCIGESRSTRVF